ncbi:MAG: hypothetical protein HOM66_02085, partial [Rhodospirillales bacterium]|nr:hypothetical protein [Rhodospirillales bacterium]
DDINMQMRAVLDEATDKWGVKVNRVEIQDIDPPHTVREAMEMQMKAERERKMALQAGSNRNSASNGVIPSFARKRHLRNCLNPLCH